MEQSSSFFENPVNPTSHKPVKFRINKNNSFEIAGGKGLLIRFQEKKDSYTWIKQDDILFVQSADHYVKSLIKEGQKKKWTIRHCTIKDLQGILNNNSFIRLNKFYLLNKKYFSYFDEAKKIIYFGDGFSIPVSHSISPFIINILRS